LTAAKSKLNERRRMASPKRGTAVHQGIEVTWADLMKKKPRAWQPMSEPRVIGLLHRQVQLRCEP
jgi:hypothetical protein